jgi:Uma2 family endonuclease
MATHLVTADDLLRMPRGSVRRELVRGVVREMPLNGRLHGAVVSHLIGFIGEHVRNSDEGGECFAAAGFQLAWNPDTVLAPDIVYVTQERDDAAGEGDGYFPGPPDLAVEVRNFTESAHEVLARGRMWIEEGVRMVLVADPDEGTITVLRPGSGDLLLTGAAILDGGDVLPGWKLPVCALFD